MNSEELKKEFGLLMPSEINGFKRPDESISSSNDFFLEIPQLISKDPVLYSTMNLIFSVILSNDKLLKQWIDTLQNVVNAQDWREVTDSLKGYMTPELKKKLDGIAAGANNYVHPSSHPASMIAQDATHRFVSDTEKNTWNGKASTSLVSTTANGLMPKRNGNASYIFTGDGVWKSLAWDLITGKPSTFAPSAHNHDSSYLKRNQTIQNDMNACTVEGIYRFSGTLSNAWTGTSWGTLLVFNNQYNAGSGTSGVFLVQLALPTDGRIWTRQRVNTGAWTSWYCTAYTDSPAFWGSPTAPTQATSDNSTKIATTAFVRNLINQLKNDGTLGGIVGGSLTQNGWVKFSNGLILQWGFRSDTGYGGRTVTFPIAFTKQCFNGHVTTKRGGDSSNGNNYVDKLTTTNMWTVCDGGGGYWLAIGV